MLIVFFHFRSEKQHITLPKNIEDAKNLGRVLSRYKDMYYFQVLGGYFITYILYPLWHFFFHFIKKSRGSNFALMKCIWRSYILRRWNIAMVVISKFRIFKLRSDFKEKYCLNKNKTRMFHLFEISLSYFSLQSFAIPGSIFLSILSGYLFPFPLALSMVCLVSINRVCVWFVNRTTFYRCLKWHGFF